MSHKLLNQNISTETHAATITNQTWRKCKKNHHWCIDRWTARCVGKGGALSVSVMCLPPTGTADRPSAECQCRLLT